MKVDRCKVKPLVFTEGDDRLTVGYSNRGEPYRAGVELQFEGDRCWVAVLLDDDRDVRALRDKLDEFLGSARSRQRNLVVLHDGAPAAIVEFSDTAVPTELLDRYAATYDIDRARLRYTVVERVTGSELK